MKWFFDLPMEFRIGLGLGIVFGVVTFVVVFG